MRSGQQRNRESRRFIRRPAVQDRVGLSRSAMYEQIGKGTFPHPVPIGARSVAWIEDEVDDWVTHRIEASRGTSGGTGGEE